MRSDVPVVETKPALVFYLAREPSAAPAVSFKRRNVTDSVQWPCRRVTGQ